MTDTRWLEGLPGYQALDHRLADLAGVLPAGTDTDLAITPLPGILHGCPVSISGLNITINQGILHVASSVSGQGVYTRVIRAPITRTAAAQPASGSRIDTLYALATTNTGEVDITLATGVAAASPVAPTLQPRALPLADITVPGAGRGSPSLTPRRHYTGAPGAVIPIPDGRFIPPGRLGQIYNLIDQAGLDQFIVESNLGRQPLRDALGADWAYIGMSSDGYNTIANSTSTTGAATWVRLAWYRIISASRGSGITLVNQDFGAGGRTHTVQVDRAGVYDLSVTVDYQTAQSGEVAVRFYTADGTAALANTVEVSTPGSAMARTAQQVTATTLLADNDSFRVEVAQSSGGSQNCVPTLIVRRVEGL